MAPEVNVADSLVTSIFVAVPLSDCAIPMVVHWRTDPNQITRPTILNTLAEHRDRLHRPAELNCKLEARLSYRVFIRGHLKKDTRGSPCGGSETVAKQSAFIFVCETLEKISEISELRSKKAVVPL